MITRAKIWISLLTFGIILLGTSCDPAKKYERQEQEKIQNYLSTHPDQNFVLKPSGLYYLDEVVGTGIQGVTNDTAYIKYTGKFLDGTVFDSNVDSTNAFGFLIGVGEVIPGLDEGIGYMKQGGTALMLMPSSIAFGNYDYRISAYTPVIFEVNLVKVGKAKKK